MKSSASCLALVSLLFAGPVITGSARAQDRPASTAHAPWEGFRNRLLVDPPTIRQHFGYRTTNHASGRAPGEIDGRVQRSTVPATYGVPISEVSLDRPLHAEGKLAVVGAEGGSGALFGWFHESSRGWRTPNSVGIRVDGNGGSFWMFYEYGTQSWQTGGGGAFEGDRYQTTATPPFKTDGRPQTWSLDYDPRGADEPGTLTFQIDDRRYETEVPIEHKRDGAKLNRFGIWNVQIAGAPLELYLDDLSVDGREWTFDRDPRWEGRGNDVEFVERVQRPWHDYGHVADAVATNNPLSDDAFGGIIFRDERPSYYGLPVGPFSLDDELHAAGRLSLVAAASDSGVYLGWFDSTTKQANDTPEQEARQVNYLSLLIEGPSRVGHYVRPAYGLQDRTGRTADGDDGWPVIRPDGRTHTWALSYHPDDETGGGTITAEFDGAKKTFAISPEERQRGVTVNRFGLFNHQAGGHQVEIYIDRLRLNARGDE
ncbi:MAG: hypothetical protein KF708_09375 [Pirellulales bacterium]|nr:hypothetical protein [Pirellulales bacterium]